MPTITLHGNKRWNGMTIPVFILDYNLNSITELTAKIGTRTQLENLKLEEFFVAQVVLPNGMKIRKRFKFSGEHAELAINIAPKSTYTADPTDFGGVLIDVEPNSGVSKNLFKSNIWFATWELDDSATWECTTATNRPSVGETKNQGLSINLKQEREIAFFQIGFDGIPSRLLAMPGIGSSLTIHYEENLNKNHHHLTCRTKSSSDFANMLSSYLRNGNVRTARLFCKSLVAEEILNFKCKDPIGAIIGGYFCLRSNNSKKLENWKHDLPSWLRMFPDVAAILIELELRTKTPSFEELKKRFLELRTRGIPLFTEGVRILVEAIRTIRKYFKSETDWIEDEESWISSFVRASDWTSIISTFSGTHPMTPSPTTANNSGVGMAPPKNPIFFVHTFTPPTKQVRESWPPVNGLEFIQSNEFLTMVLRWCEEFTMRYPAIDFTDAASHVYAWFDGKLKDNKYFISKKRFRTEAAFVSYLRQCVWNAANLAADQRSFSNQIAEIPQYQPTKTRNNSEIEPILETLDRLDFVRRTVFECIFLRNIEPAIVADILNVPTEKVNALYEDAIDEIDHDLNLFFPHEFASG